VLLEVLGTAIWVLFVAEFLLRLALAPRKLPFVARNWLNVLSLLLPALRLLRVFRLLRVARAVRGLRLVRLVGGANCGMGALRSAMKRRGLGYLLALTVVVTLLGAAGMRTLEGAASPEVFGRFGDALWWTVMIITALGSEGWPKTLEGRLLCVGLSLYAFAVFGYITAAFASFFVDWDRSEADLTADEIRALRAELAGARARSS